MKNIYFILTILLIASCKLLSPNDTTPPQIQLSIEGGNEISRGVTLYLDIKDDSKIDYVSVMIDDTTAVTVESNFDTIRFDVTPFADESEHILYVEVADKEGNIGESEKIDVVITEFPGWRIYDDLNLNYAEINLGILSFGIDENELIWIGTNSLDGPSVKIYDIKNANWRIISSGNSQLPNGWIWDIKFIEGSRAWLVTGDHISEYDYGYARWIQVVKKPQDSREFEAIALDNNYNVYIGDYKSRILFKYNGADYTKFINSPIREPHDMVFDGNGILYIAGITGIATFNNNVFTQIDGVPQSRLCTFTIDNFNNIWIGTGFSGLYKKSNSNIDYIPTPSSENAIPLMVDRNNILYSEFGKFDDSKGIVTYDSSNWLYWNTLYTPFNPINIDNTDTGLARQAIGEVSNGDIWMVVNGKLMRYRPSLGGYP